MSSFLLLLVMLISHALKVLFHKFLIFIIIYSYLVLAQLKVSPTCPWEKKVVVLSVSDKGEHSAVEWMRLMLYSILLESMNNNEN